MLDETGTALRTLATIIADFIIVVSDQLRAIADNIIGMDWVAIQRAIMNVITSIIGVIIGGIGTAINLIVSTVDAITKASMSAGVMVGQEISAAGAGVGARAVPK